MKYKILATNTFDHYIEFDSEKMYTKDGLLEIVSDILRENSETINKFNPRVDWNVCSGMYIEYEVEKGENRMKTQEVTSTKEKLDKFAQIVEDLKNNKQPQIHTDDNQSDKNIEGTRLIK